MAVCSELKVLLLFTIPEYAIPSDQAEDLAARGITYEIDHPPSCATLDTSLERKYVF